MHADEVVSQQERSRMFEFAVQTQRLEQARTIPFHEALLTDRAIYTSQRARLHDKALPQRSQGPRYVDPHAI